MYSIEKTAPVSTVKFTTSMKKADNKSIVNFISLPQKYICVFSTMPEPLDITSKAKRELIAAVIKVKSIL